MSRNMYPELMNKIDQLSKDQRKKLREVVKQKRQEIRQSLVDKGFTERELNEHHSLGIPTQKLRRGSNIWVRVWPRDPSLKSIKVKLSYRATAREAVLAAGLWEPGGPPFRCLDASSTEIDDIELNELIPDRLKVNDTDTAEYLQGLMQGEIKLELPLVEIFVATKVKRSLFPWLPKWVTRDSNHPPPPMEPSKDMSQTEVTVCLRDKTSTRITLSMPKNATAVDAMNDSGLIARDGTPYRCFDSRGKVIDNMPLANLSSDIYLGVPTEIQPVMIEESTCRGRIGKGRLMDGTTIFVPKLKEGDFAWVVVSGRHGRNGCRANGFTVRMDGEAYRRGDLITIKPGPYAKRARIFNPRTCKWDLPIELKVPDNVNRDDYVGLMWTVRITQTSPLVGVLDTNLTWRPDNQPEIARKARAKVRNKQRKKRQRASHA